MLNLGVVVRVQLPVLALLLEDLQVYLLQTA